MATIPEAIAEGLRYHQAGQYANAAHIYRQILAVDPNQPDALHLLGVAAYQEGRFAEAVELIGQAIRWKQTDPAYFSNQGNALKRLGRLDEAIVCYRRALEMKPDYAEAHNNLGSALQDFGQPAEALKHYRIALGLQPESAVANMNLGGLHEAQGELAEAEEAFRQAVKKQPELPLPFTRLANLLRGNLPEGDRQAIDRFLADPGLAADIRARLLFGQVQVLDAQGDFAGACRCAQEANSISRQFGRPYSSTDHEHFVDGVLREFRSRFFRRLSGAGLAGSRPIFVFGLPRSGTTLVEQILASHSQVHGAGELRFAQESFEAVPAALGRTGSPIDSLAHLDASTLRRLAERHDLRLRQLAGASSRRVVDKMPGNYKYLGLLAVLFPDAAFIHCRRDLRDVAVSCWLTDFSDIPWASDFANIASRFKEYRRLTQHWKTAFPAPIHEVNYEEIVADVESGARRLVTACGLEWEPGCLDFHRARRLVRTASVTQVRQPIYHRSAGRWRNYESLLADLFAQLPPE